MKLVDRRECLNSCESQGNVPEVTVVAEEDPVLAFKLVSNLSGESDTWSKRLMKPVRKLIYNEPGKSKDEPLIIIHRGLGSHL